MNQYDQDLLRPSELDHYEQGVEQLAVMLGAERAQAIIERFRGLSPAFEKEVIAVVFGRTWSRKALDRKTRSLCSVCILAALGRTDGLRVVFELAVRSGATIDEISEALLQVAIYAGYPAALDALAALEAALANLTTMPGRRGENRSDGERRTTNSNGRCRQPGSQSSPALFSP